MPCASSLLLVMMFFCCMVDPSGPEPEGVCSGWWSESEAEEVLVQEGHQPLSVSAQICGPPSEGGKSDEDGWSVHGCTSEFVSRNWLNESKGVSKFHKTLRVWRLKPNTYIFPFHYLCLPSYLFITSPPYTHTPVTTHTHPHTTVKIDTDSMTVIQDPTVDDDDEVEVRPPTTYGVIWFLCMCDQQGNSSWTKHSDVLHPMMFSPLSLLTHTLNITVHVVLTNERCQVHQLNWGWTYYLQCTNCIR